MKQYVTVEKQKKGLRARVIQVNQGLFGNSLFTEDEIIGSRVLVKIYLEANYPKLSVESGEELLFDEEID